MVGADGYSLGGTVSIGADVADSSGVVRGKKVALTLGCVCSWRT